MDPWEFLKKNVEWLFSGIGVAALSVIYYLFKKKPSARAKPETSVIINNSQNIGATPAAVNVTTIPLTPPSLPKAAVSILFVDDDTRFQVVNILKKNGWSNTRIIRDITSLEQPEVASADIFFIDIQGVGKALGFKDQGLGLVVALKRKYHDKKIVIYSAETADAFHSAFKQADDMISKDADPYEFMETVERLSPR